MYKNVFKRLLDIVASLCGLILLSPIFITVVLILFIANNGKPFFFQKRPGKNGQIFNIVKFKTMNDKTDEKGELLPFEHRVTKIGLFIRKYSLDEIPQLLNVIGGQMSIVGPRPLLVQYLPLYSDFQQRRHEVRPGITGWAQVNGRNALSWNEKFKFDVWYVENLSFALDVKILFLTVKKVFLREGVNSSDTVNMEAFTGNG
ncbi:putative sugar transferase EpsL [Flagellimonas maritima]|uniref:Putative sugar transferase EpsL n=1 Tax=Flagellimonas maritima TaxID=1383885 RepID=A0A2Z4LWQ0_9FLAO|nr:sugar transferase [Allomuricauda aurantiaca]AWX45798.1 putative sugar transferase EpsL [Allomuricauda aurantiaca]